MSQHFLLTALKISSSKWIQSSWRTKKKEKMWGKTRTEYFYFESNDIDFAKSQFHRMLPANITTALTGIPVW
jgi:hypothetical protein